MAKLPITATTPPTVLAIYEHYERMRGDWRRAHLGASQIGKPCERALWYQFRWASAPQFDGRMLRLFDTGQREEARLIADLRSIGIEVHEVDESTGRQFEVSDHGGHFGGSLDGAGRGFRESSQWHVLEFKTSNAKRFEELKRQGVEKARPEHYAQMQVYMHLTGMQRAYYFAVCKDTDEIYGERVRYDATKALWRLERARRIIEAAAPPPRLSDDPDYYLCRWCEHRAVCHGGHLPHVPCRTCVHATPELDGDRRWSCAFWKKDLTLNEQKRGCGQHLFIPGCTPWEVVDANPEDNSITYDRHKNGGVGGLDSVTLREVVNGAD